MSIAAHQPPQKSAARSEWRATPPWYEPDTLHMLLLHVYSEHRCGHTEMLIESRLWYYYALTCR
jgi:hypothetical protein